MLAIGAWLAALIWYRPLTLPDEGRYAGVAWDMLRAGSHGCPCWTACPISTSRRCTTGCLNSSSRCSPHPWLARLPSWMAAWGTSIALYFFVLRHRDRATATMTTLILACMPFFYGGAQFANLDMLVAGMISLCVLAAAETALRAEQGQAYRVMSLVAAALAAGRARQGLDRAGAWRRPVHLAGGRQALARPEGVGLAARAAAVRGGRGAVVLADADALLGLYDYFFVYQLPALRRGRVQQCPAVLVLPAGDRRPALAVVPAAGGDWRRLLRAAARSLRRLRWLAPSRCRRGGGLCATPGRWPLAV